MYFQSENNELDQLVELINLAGQAGLDREDWLLLELEKLGTRWDEWRYQHLVRRVISSEGFPSMLNQVFKKTVAKDDLEALQGTYNIGRVMDSDIPVGLSITALNLHTLIPGQTGFGKTNCLNALSESVQQEGEIHEWKIDPKTKMGDFQYQLKKFPNSVLVTLSQLKLNPFGPIVGVPRRAVMEQAIEVIADSFSVFDASQGVIAEHVEKMFERVEFPTFKMLSDSILSEKRKSFSRRQTYIETIETRLNSTLTSLREVLDCRKDFFNLLFNRSVIFEVGGISSVAIKLLVPLIIMKLSLFKTYNPSRGLSHLLYFDEAQGAIFSKALELRGRTPTVAILATQARSYGLGLVVLCQNPVTKIITEMLSNTCSHICFHVGGPEVDGMRNCMGLTQEQGDKLRHIPPGEALFKTALGYTEPVHILVNEIDNTPPSNEEMEKLMRPIWEELNDSVMVVKEKTEVAMGSKPEAAKTKQKDENQLDEACEILLKDVQARPWEHTEDHYRNCSLSRNRAVKAKARLVRLGLLDEVKIRTGKRGKPTVMLRLTEKAVVHLGISSKRGKGSHAHRWWQYYALHLAKQIPGVKAKVEDMSCDISISKGDGKDIAVEITLHDSNILTNIERNFAKGFGEVWLAVKTDAMRSKCNEQLAARILKQGKVRVLLLEELAVEIKKYFAEECND